MASTPDITIRRGLTWRGMSLFCKDENGEPVPLAGWSAYSQIRKTADGPLVLDLAPTIAADDADGLITIPPVNPAATSQLPPGEHVYDVILEDPEGNRLDPPLITAKVTISRTITQPP
jgi:hypothetical protein